MIRLREQIAKVLKTDKKMTGTWREILKIVLAKSESIIKKCCQTSLQQSIMKKGG